MSISIKVPVHLPVKVPVKLPRSFPACLPIKLYENLPARCVSSGFLGSLCGKIGV